MLGLDPYYHAAVRTQIIAFGSIFKDMKIIRESKRVKVPIVYSTKADWYTRLQEQPETEVKGAKTRIVLPRMGYSWNLAGPDSTRKLNSVQQRYNYGDGSNPSTMFERVPWTINWELYVAVKNEEDGLQIMEQIIPFFNPALTVSIEDSPLNGDPSTDITFNLTSVEHEKDYEGSLPKIRTINYTYRFTSPIYFAGPVQDGSGLIRKVIVNTYQGLDRDVARRIHRLTVQPDPLTAGPNDDFTYTINETYFSNAFEIDSETGVDVAEMSSSSSSSSESTNESSSSSSSSRTSSSSSNSSPSSSSSS